MAIQENQTFELVGLQELMDLIKDLPVLVQANLIRNVESKILREQIVKPMQAALPYRKESESKIRTTTDTKDKTAVWAGPSAKIFWYRFADKGTKDRTTKSGNTFKGISGSNRIAPLVNAAVPKIIEQFNTEFGEILAKTMERKVKKLNK